MVRHLKIGPLVQKLDKVLLEALKNKTKHDSFFSQFLSNEYICSLLHYPLQSLVKNLCKYYIKFIQLRLGRCHIYNLGHFKEIS